MNNSNDKLGNAGFEFREGVQDAWEPNDGQFFIGKVDEPAMRSEPTDRIPYAPTSVITKVNGVEAYSQAAALYKGKGKHQNFIPQPGLNMDTGKMPPGKFNPEPPREYVERNKMGFAMQGPYDKYGKIPIISPPASGVEESTTWDYAVHTTVRDLKRALGRGMGSRTNKYLLEFDLPMHHTVGLEKFNILCYATSLPQRSMSTATLWRMGRKYNVRGEVDYGGTWNLTFLEDSEMSVRRALEAWHIDIDNSKLQGTALEGIYDPVASKVRHRESDLYFREHGYKDQYFGATGAKLGSEYAPSTPRYQTDIKIFQLDQVGNRVLGYLMQNAFISEISAMEFADDQENQLSKTTGVITFSEFLPLEPSNTSFFHIKPQY